MLPKTLLANLLTFLMKWLSSLHGKYNALINKQYPQKIALYFHHIRILAMKWLGQRLIQLRGYTALLRKSFHSLLNFSASMGDKTLTIIDRRSLQVQNYLSAASNRLTVSGKTLAAAQKCKLLDTRTRVAQSPQAQKLKLYAQLIRLDKPIGILLLLWPTLIALWIAAGGWPDTDVLLVFVAGVILMRSAGCAINDYADRHIDLKVRRTKDRPLTTGKISEKEVLIIFAALSITAFMLVLLMNTLTIIMSLIGVALAASYPFMKRYHYLPQIHLGAAFGWAVPMAYAAQTNELHPVAWLLFIATVLWTTVYDTLYAMVDREDDLKIGVKSTAILFESADRLIIGIIQALLILCLIMIGLKAELGGFYYAGVLVAVYLAIWQQYLIRDRQPAACFQAFLNNNWLGLALFVGVFLEYQLGGITS
jgi:4-hydroxybenzoate polyprenyltransferase